MEQLHSYINKLSMECIKQGNLYGILLIGLNHDSMIELFQSYINRTSDVQTAAVAIMHSSIVKTSTAKFMNAWIESYRDLLDCWMLWEQRALYDISRARPVEPKIFLKCGYCGENISSKRKQRNLDTGANIV
jgi:hypothetical protein